MPFRMLPNSDASSLAALRVLTTKQAATTPAEWPYDAARGAENVACFTLFAKELGERTTAEATRNLATTQADAAMNRTRQLVSHFLQTLQNGVDRHALKREDRAFYNLGLEQRDVPVMTSIADVITWATNVIEGEKRRQAAVPAGGTFVPVTFPSAAEVKTELDALDALQTAQSEASEHATAESNDVIALRARVGTAILESWDDIQNKYRRLPAPAYRAQAKEWGVTFISRLGETPEPGVDPAPAATPTDSTTTSPGATGTTGTPTPPQT